MPEGRKANVEMWKLKKAEQIEFQKDQFKWCASQDVCLLVRLVQNRRVDHCILIDRSSSLIYDSAEESPLQLTCHSLRLCGGPRVPHLEVKDVRRLRKQREKMAQLSTNRKVVKQPMGNGEVPKRVRITRSFVKAAAANSSTAVVDLTQDY